MSEETIIEIRQHADIVDIISDYIDLKQKGKNYVAVCPFHDDHNPSMVVSKEKQIFNCFTCHTGGNVFSFVMKYENISFIEAVRVVANKVGINVHINSVSSNNKYKKEYEIMDLSNKYYVNNMNTPYGIEAREYLNNRGISDDIIKDFKIGVALDEKNDLYSFLTKHNYSADVMESVGLVNKSGINVYDAFTNRIMIPISNYTGQIVAYTGRIFHNEDLAKYINTKDTKIYIKGELLFNYHNAKNYIREAGKLIVVEGNMDAIKMYSSGIKNVIALMGTALTKYQINLIKKLKVPIILLLDNDDAGLNATINVGKLLKENNVKVEVVRLKDFKDPDEYITKAGIEKFKNVLNKTYSYLDFMIDYYKSLYNLTNSDDLVAYIKCISELLINEDTITREIIANKIAKENNIDPGLIYNKNQEKTTINKNPVKELGVRKRDSYKLLCERILYYLISDSKYINIFSEEVGYFADKDCREIFNDIKFFNKNNKNGSMADLIAYFGSSNDHYDDIIRVISENENLEPSYDGFYELLVLLKHQNTNLEIKELKNNIKNEKDINKKMELLNQLAKIKKGSVDNDRD